MGRRLCRFRWLGYSNYERNYTLIDCGAFDRAFVQLPPGSMDELGGCFAGIDKVNKAFPDVPTSSLLLLLGSVGRHRSVPAFWLPFFNGTPLKMRCLIPTRWPRLQRCSHRTAATHASIGSPWTAVCGGVFLGEFPLNPAMPSNGGWHSFIDHAAFPSAPKAVASKPPCTARARGGCRPSSRGVLAERMQSNSHWRPRPRVKGGRKTGNCTALSLASLQDWRPQHRN